MNPTRGYYSLIQYCPDLSRLEAVNLGVLLFRPEPHFLRARTTPSVQRIRRFFGSQDRDWEQLRALRLAIEERLEVEGNRIQTLADLERFIATRGNEMQITPPRPVRVLHAEQDLEMLFERLVGGQRSNEIRPVAGLLEEVLTHQDVAPYVRRDISVLVPVLHRPLTVPFGYQNGRFHLIRPAPFSHLTLSAAISRACRYAVEGHSLYDHPDEELGELRLVVVGGFAPGQEEGRTVVGDILRENKVQLYTQAELDRLVQEIRDAGKLQTA